MKRRLWLFMFLPILLTGCGILSIFYNPVYVSTSQAKNTMEKETDYAVVEIGDVKEYDLGHIPGAICLSLDEINKDIVEKLPDKKQKIYIYARESNYRESNDGEKAAKQLCALGYPKVIYFGLIDDWTYETEQGAAVPGIMEKTEALIDEKKYAEAYEYLCNEKIMYHDIEGLNELLCYVSARDDDLDKTYYEFRADALDKLAISDYHGKYKADIVSFARVYRKKYEKQEANAYKEEQARLKQQAIVDYNLEKWRESIAAEKAKKKSNQQHNQKSDEYNVYDYSDPEDFYDDYSEDFDGFEDAEDYYDEAWDD